MTRKRKYTLRNLGHNSSEYDRNFKKMVESVDTDKHKIYVKLEKELNARDIDIRKDLGLLAQDPCRLTKVSTCCLECTGFYRHKKKGGFNPISIECKSDAKGAVPCVLKQDYQ